MYNGQELSIKLNKLVIIIIILSSILFLVILDFILSPIPCMFYFISKILFRFEIIFNIFNLGYHDNPPTSRINRVNCYVNSEI